MRRKDKFNRRLENFVEKEQTMIFYSLIAAVTIGLACMVNNHAVKKSFQVTRQQMINYVCLAGIFLILAGTAALRIDVGNDYGSYVNTFHEIVFGYKSSYVVTEPGFNFVVKLIYTLSGFENYLLVFALFGGLTVFFFLKAMYDQSVDFKWAFALFMLLGLYFRTFNTVRYYFVLALTLYSIRFVMRKQYVKFILLICFAALFHKSVLVVIPLFLLTNVRWKRWQVILGGIAAVLVFVFQDLVMKLALYFYPSYKDTVYLEKGTGILASASGILRCGAVLLLAGFVWLSYRKKGETLFASGKDADRETAAAGFYLKTTILALAIYLCASFLPLVSRITYYLITPQILFVPWLLSKIRDRKTRRLAAGAVLLFCLCNFIYFLLTAHQEGVMVLPYKTWIFTEKEWLIG